MRYVGLDYHTEKSFVFISDDADEEIFRGNVYSVDLRKLLENFDGAKVLFEAGYGWPRLVKALDGLPIDLSMCHPESNRLIATDRRKSDGRDARNLAMYLKTNTYKEVYMPDDAIRDERQIVRSRMLVAQQITRFKNRTYSTLAYAGIQKTSLRIFAKKNRHYFDTLKLSPESRELIDMLLESLDFHRDQKKNLDRMISEMNDADPRARLLKTIPGVGDVTSRVLLSEIGDIGRFRTPDSLACYAGLVPKQRQSGNSMRSMGITKEGSSNMRHVLVQAAWIAIRRDPALKEFYENVKERRGSNVAICAVARKLINASWHILTKNAPYKAQKPIPKDNPAVARGKSSASSDR